MFLPFCIADGLGLVLVPVNWKVGLKQQCIWLTAIQKQWVIQIDFITGNQMAFLYDFELVILTTIN